MEACADVRTPRSDGAADHIAPTGNSLDRGTLHAENFLARTEKVGFMGGVIFSQPMQRFNFGCI